MSDPSPHDRYAKNTMREAESSAQIDKETGLILCIATHPKTPNLSGHARGRRPHLIADIQRFSYHHTVCGMLVERNLESGTTFALNKVCGGCRQQFQQMVRKR